MIGLLLIGLALIFGIGMKIVAYSGSLMLFLMWLAILPLEHNPFLDDHLVYILILIFLVNFRTGQWFGFGKWWAQTKLVKRYKFLE